MPGKKKGKVPIKSHTSDDDENSTDSGSRQNGDLSSHKFTREVKSESKPSAEPQPSPQKKGVKRSADDSPESSPLKKVYITYGFTL